MLRPDKILDLVNVARIFTFLLKSFTTGEIASEILQIESTIERFLPCLFKTRCTSLFR